MRLLIARTAVLALACALLVLTAPSESHAETGLETLPQIPPSWNVRFDSPVVWQRVGPLGHLLVRTSGALSGVDPENGRVVWSHGDLGSLAEDHYEPIPGTPLVSLSDGLAKPRVIILNSADGRVVFDSRTAGVAQVLSRHLLPRSGGLLLLGFRQGKPSTTMFMFDATTGALRWENDALLGKAGKVTRFLTALVQAATNTSGVVAEPFEVPGGSFLLASVTDLFSIDTRTGRINWQVRNITGDGRQTRFFMTRRTPEVVYVGTETATRSGSGESVQTYYAAHRLRDGASVWPEPVRLKGAVNDVIFTKKGLVVSPRGTSKGKIKLLEYASGRSPWGKKGKGIEVLGGIVDHDRTRTGIVITTGYDSAWTNAGPQYYLNVLDVEAGALRFEKGLKVNGRILSTDVLPHGVLFVTTHEMNMLDPATGKTRFRRPVESEDSLVTAESARAVYAFSVDEGMLYRLDKNRGTLEILSKQRVKFEEDDVPMSLELTRDQITVVGSQNVAAYRGDGQLKFHAYHPSPRRPALMRALLRAQQVRAGMAAFFSGAMSTAFAHSAAQQPEGSLSRTVNAGLAEGYATTTEDLARVSGRFGEMARVRFKASATAPDFVFMMVKRARGAYGLARVSKATGAIEGIIDLGRDKKPSYQVDGVTNKIFYSPTSSAIVGYRF